MVEPLTRQSVTKGVNRPVAVGYTFDDLAKAILADRAAPPVAVLAAARLRILRDDRALVSLWREAKA